MITSRQNARLKDIRRLRRCKGELAILEGPHLVAEACAAGVPLEEVLASPEFLAGPAAAGVVDRLAVRPVEVAAPLLDELCDADSPRGLLAVARLPRGGAETLPAERGAVYLLLDGLQDPANLGALARVAEAAGAGGLALAPGSVHPNHPRALRASAGSLLRLPVARGVEPDALARRLHGLDPRWVALVPRGGRPLYATPVDGTPVLLLGAEGPGLSPTLLERADLRITIPLSPPVESLNAAVAAALVLFELHRRTLPKPGG